MATSDCVTGRSRAAMGTSFTRALYESPGGEGTPAGTFETLSGQRHGLAGLRRLRGGLGQAQSLDRIVDGRRGLGARDDRVDERGQLNAVGVRVALQEEAASVTSALDRRTVVARMLSALSVPVEPWASRRWS